MTPKKLWIVTMILLTLHLTIQYRFFVTINLTGTSALTTFLFDLFFNLISISICGIGLGALAALIPFEQKSFKEKIKTTFPLLTSIVLLILVSTFCYLLYLKKVKGMELKPLHTYKDIKIPENLD